MILHVASYPRSGNSLFCTTILSMGGFIKDKNDREWEIVFTDDTIPFELTPEEVAQYHYRKFNLNGQNPQTLQEDNRKLFISKTHHLPESPHIVGKSIMVVRDGKDALASNAVYESYHRGMYGLPHSSIQECLKDLIHGKTNPALVWEEYVKRWIESDKLGTWTKYEDMVSDPAGEVSRCLGTVGFIWDKKHKLLPFEFLQKKNRHHFRHGKVGTYKEVLNGKNLDDFCAKAHQILRFFRYK